MTPEQSEYAQGVRSGNIQDVLAYLTSQGRRRPAQAYCTVNNGFLAYGRQLIPSTHNRLALRTPARCTDFGTDSMVMMLEWLGRQVDAKYSSPEYRGVRLLVGDISAPRGGCLAGRAGRRGHASHTSGLDVDLGFLTVKKNQPSPAGFHKKFDADSNWWLVKRLFENPYACVKVIFLDRRLINKLAKVAWKDPAWALYGRYIRHVRSHHHHFHIRVGEGPGGPGTAGCSPAARPELEPEPEDEESVDETSHPSQPADPALANVR